MSDHAPHAPDRRRLSAAVRRAAAAALAAAALPSRALFALGRLLRPDAAAGDGAAAPPAGAAGRFPRALPPRPTGGRWSRFLPRRGGRRGPTPRADVRPPAGPDDAARRARFRRDRGLFVAAVLAAACAAGGCGATGAYVAADRATFDAVAPEYAGYVAADPALTPEQKARRARTVDAWRLRLDHAAAAAQAAP